MITITCFPLYTLGRCIKCKFRKSRFLLTRLSTSMLGDCEILSITLGYMQITQDVALPDFPWSDVSRGSSPLSPLSIERVSLWYTKLLLFLCKSQDNYLTCTNNVYVFGAYKILSFYLFHTSVYVINLTWNYGFIIR